MTCYYPGCKKTGTTKEHIPPKSFFPDDEKKQLLTVRSCDDHNGLKSKNDYYVLAHISMNASPNNRAREIFQNNVAPQLEYNNGALKKMLAKNAIQLADGSVSYPVEISRFNDFFSALSYGVILKSCGATLPEGYKTSHLYHNLKDDNESEFHKKLNAEIHNFYSTKPIDVLHFGDPDTQNKNIYTATIFGMPNFMSSITIVHEFFGVFKVTSMLTKSISPHLED